MSTLQTIKATLETNNLESNENVINLYISEVSALDENDGAERELGMKSLVSQGFNKDVLEVVNDYVCTWDDHF